MGNHSPVFLTPPGNLPNRPNCNLPIIVVDVILDRSETGRIRVSPARASPTSCGEEPSMASIKSAESAMAWRSATAPAPLQTYHTVPFDRLDSAIDELFEQLSTWPEDRFAAGLGATSRIPAGWRLGGWAKPRTPNVRRWNGPSSLSSHRESGQPNRRRFSSMSSVTVCGLSYP